MRLLEHFDENGSPAHSNERPGLHLWVAGDGREMPRHHRRRLAVCASRRRARAAMPMTHAFYCGGSPSHGDHRDSIHAEDIASQRIGDIATSAGRMPSPT